MKFLDALRNVSSGIDSKFKDSQLFTHPLEIGNAREQIISTHLRSFLPECYGLGSGQIFSSDGGVSKQIDIVIYDNVYSNVLFKGENASLFPCESVYGEIEVKSHLSTKEFEKSLCNIESMKMLTREDSLSTDITPLYRLPLGKGFSFPLEKRNPYLGVIFGFDSISDEILLEKLDELVRSKDKSLLPDFIFSYKGNFMICKMNSNNELAGMSDDFSHYAVARCSKDIIPIMFLTLNTCLSQIHLKAPDYNEYWINILKDSLSFDEMKNN